MRFEAVKAARIKNKLLFLNNLSGFTTKVTEFLKKPLKRYI